MIISHRLRALREKKKPSQGGLENRLKRSYISRVGSGHTVPSIETLERLAGGLECPQYFLFYDGEGSPPLATVVKSKEDVWESGAQYFDQLSKLVAKTDDSNRVLLLDMARTVANRGTRKRQLI